MITKSVSFCVAISITPDQFSTRLQESALKKGIKSARELFEGMKERGYEVNLGGIRKHWERKFVPDTPYVMAYADFLEVPTDWLLFGKKDKFTPIELKQIVGEMIVEAGGEIPVNDPTVTEVTRLLSKMETQEQRQMVIRIIKSVLGEDLN